MQKRKWFYILILFGILVDQISKVWIFQSLAGDWNPNRIVQYGPNGHPVLHTESSAVIQDILHFTPSLNTGGAFSLFSESPAAVLILTIIAVLILIVLFVMYGLNTKSKVLLWSYGLLMVGAGGNLIDRVWFGMVRDFFDFKPEIPFIGHWAIFNVADVCICVGAGLFILAEIKAMLRPEPTDQEGETISETQ